MITHGQLNSLAKQYKINESTILREYLQIIFLKHLYEHPQSSNIFFKGGTAIHLLFKAPRFSADLDFTVNMDEKQLLSLLQTTMDSLEQVEPVSWKERDSLTGKQFILSSRPDIVPYKTYINLDFSFREKILKPQRAILETDYPVLFTSYIHHLSAPEIVAEKIQAVMTRKKGRDLYDLWYLLTKKVTLDNTLIKQKLNYYRLEKTTADDIRERVASFTEKEFVLDVRPFIPINEREKLPKFFSFVKDYLKQNL